jgi:hypothetical protein
MWASVVSVVIILCIHHTVASFSVRDHRPFTLEGNPCPTRPYISDCLFFVMVPILGHPPDAGEGNPTVG